MQIGPGPTSAAVANLGRHLRNREIPFYLVSSNIRVIQTETDSAMLPKAKQSFYSPPSRATDWVTSSQHMQMSVKHQPAIIRIGSSSLKVLGSLDLRLSLVHCRSRPETMMLTANVTNYIVKRKETLYEQDI